MRTFKQYIEAITSQASVENFPHDFEQTLNLITGGTWTLVDSKPSFGGFDPDLNQSLTSGIDAQYRGMSENGRHYQVSVSLADRMYQQRAKLGRKFTTYNLQGSPGLDPDDAPFVFFMIWEIWELGKDTEINNKKQPESRAVTFKQIRHLKPVDMAKQLKDVINTHEQQNDVPKPLLKLGQTIQDSDADEDQNDPADWWKKS